MMTKLAELLNEKVPYSATDDKDNLALVKAVWEGIGYQLFARIVEQSPFAFEEWSHFLHLSERTLQRYRKGKRTFDPLQSEKILQITLLYRMGTEVFGSSEKFNAWLDTENIALGKMKPKKLLDNAFGIEMLKDELTRIEHGVLA